MDRWLCLATDRNHNSIVLSRESTKGHAAQCEAWPLSVW